MHRVFEAIMTLGRAIDEIDRHGWSPGRIGQADGPKCASGLLTHALTGEVHYLTGVPEEHALTLRASAYALVSVPPLKQELPRLAYRAANVLHAYGTAEKLRAAAAGSDDLETLERAVVWINDYLITSEEDARQWFSDALDVLAEQLPVPASPVVPEVVPEVEGRPLVSV